MLRKKKTDMSYKSKNLYHQCHYVLTNLCESDGSPTTVFPPPLSPVATPHFIPSMEDSRPSEDNSQTGQGKMQRERAKTLSCGG